MRLSVTTERLGAIPTYRARRRRTRMTLRRIPLPQQVSARRAFTSLSVGHLNIGGDANTRYVSHLRRDLPAHAFVSQPLSGAFGRTLGGADGNHNTGCPRYPRARSIA